MNNDESGLKLLIFSPYYPPHVGGVENYTRELAAHLSERNIKTTIFTPDIPKIKENAAPSEKIKIIRFPAFEIISNYPLPRFWHIKFWKFFLSLFKYDFDAVISQTRFFNTTLLAFFYAKVKRKRWIHIEHGSDFINTSSRLANVISRAYDLTLGRLIFKFSNLNIAISEAVKRFIGKFDQRPVPVIYRGLDFRDIDSVNPDEEIKRKYNDKIIIAYTGRLYRWKGVENSIRAVMNLPKDIKNKVIFIIAGDGEDYEKIKEMADESIVMLGSVPREKVFGILKTADIYIHSSLPGGGLSTSLLEAMYCQCAIVATKNEGADEVIQSDINGILIEKSDPLIIKEKLIELIEDKEKREQYSQKAKEHIADSFLWGKNIERLIDYF